MSQPLVSIVAINYNNGKYVIENLNSIASQTYENIELIIVDDCSTDDSKIQIREWLKNYGKPFVFIEHSENQGICKTFNDGYKEAKGKYISSIATDDIMLPEKIEKQVGILEKTESSVGMLYSDVYLIQENSKPMYGWFIQKYRNDFVELPSGNIYDKLLEGNFIPAMSIMIKKEILNNVGLFDENLDYEDYDMWLRISREYQVVYSDYPSAFYRLSNSGVNLSTKRSVWLLNNIKIFLKHLPNTKAENRIVDIIKTSFYNNDTLIRDFLFSDLTFPNKEIKKIKNIWKIPLLSHKIKNILIRKL